MNKEQKLYDYLEKHHIGRDKAVHSKKLEKKFDICPRTVRAYINNLRKSGLPVCSDDKGYWVAKDPKEAIKSAKRWGDFANEVNNARTGLAVAAIQMRSITKITEENVTITVKVG